MQLEQVDPLQAEVGEAALGARADVVRGGGGGDTLLGGSGNDRIMAKDKRRDVVDGGPGRDVGSFDRKLDRVRSVEIRTY